MSAQASAGTLHAAVLPADRATASPTHHYLATLINDTDAVARNCRIELDDDQPLTLSYWTTDQTTNATVGRRDEPADLFPRKAQAFRFMLVAEQPIAEYATFLYPSFVCDDMQPAIQLEGVNSVDLRAFRRQPPFHRTKRRRKALLSPLAPARSFATCDPAEPGDMIGTWMADHAGPESARAQDSPAARVELRRPSGGAALSITETQFKMEIPGLGAITRTYEVIAQFDQQAHLLLTDPLGAQRELEIRLHDCGMTIKQDSACDDDYCINLREALIERLVSRLPADVDSRDVARNIRSEQRLIGPASQFLRKVE